MAFPHPQSRKDHCRKEHVPGWSGIVRQFVKRTINISEDRNAEDEVYPANNRTLGGHFHDCLRKCGWRIICDPPICLFELGAAIASPAYLTLSGWRAQF